MAFFYTRDQCLAQLSSEKLPPVADENTENKYRDPQPDMQRVRDLGTLSHKTMRCVHQIPLLRAQRTPRKKKNEFCF